MFGYKLVKEKDLLEIEALAIMICASTYDTEDFADQEKILPEARIEAFKDSVGFIGETAQSILDLVKKL